MIRAEFIAKQNTPPGKEMQLTYQEMHVFDCPGVLSCASAMVLCEWTACGVIEKKRALCEEAVKARGCSILHADRVVRGDGLRGH